MYRKPCTEVRGSTYKYVKYTRTREFHPQALKESPKTFYRSSKFLEYPPIVLIAATRHVGLFEWSDI